MSARPLQVGLATALTLSALVWAALPGARLKDLYPLEGMVQPGGTAHIQIEMDRPWYDPRPVTLIITAGLSPDPIATIRTLSGSVEWSPPAAGGYGVTAQLGDQRLSTAIDVGVNWASRPRYGFVTDFGPGDRGQEERFRTMARFHINGLQFYDWHYRHHDYLPPDAEYRDPLGRLLSRDTLLEKLQLARNHGMAAMAYTAVYAAPGEFYQQHKDWALYDVDGHPLAFGDDFLFIMDPRPGEPWAEHIMTEYAKIVRELPFDGIHLDQFGDPRYGYSAAGEPVSLGLAFAGLIDATRERLGDRPLIFNDVAGWSLADTAASNKDVVYVEVWPPHLDFQRLYDLIAEGRRRSGGKPVILAAYISPDFAPSVLLTDAVIFASGGYHLEIGEGSAMLYDPYFPKHRQIDAELQQHLRRYYDVIVRYQELLYPPERSSWAPAVTISGSRTLPGGYFNGVWPIGWEVGENRLLHLINLNGLSDARWNGGRLEPPTLLEEGAVTVAVESPPKALYLIDPDGPDQSPQPLAFTYREGEIQFQLDRLAYWSILVFES